MDIEIYALKRYKLATVVAARDEHHTASTAGKRKRNAVVEGEA